MRRRLGAACFLISAVFLGFAGAWEVGNSSRSEAAGATSNVATTTASFTALQEGDLVVAGSSDGQNGLWVLARDSVRSTIRAYHFGGALGSRRIDLSLTDAGRLGSIAVTRDGLVWAGAGQRLVAFDPLPGLIRTAMDLPPAQRAVARAQRTPDGTTLGLGQITAIAGSATGIWIARYAAPELIFIDATFAAKRVALPADVDVAQLATVDGQVWFTTNFGTDERLGAVIGRIDQPASVTFIATPAGSLAVASSGLHALGQLWRELDGKSGQTIAARPLPRQPIDVAAVAVDNNGQLIARGARQAQLHVFDRNGSEVRSIGYVAGSFMSRGRMYASTAPLAFLVVGRDGTIWFGSQSGSVVYKAA